MKHKILKLIFILSFIPYIYFLFGLLFGKYMVNGVELKGAERLLEIITILPNYIMGNPIIPACLTFQMCYKFKNNVNDMFVCSFIPYLFLLLFGLKGAIFGETFISGTDPSYGVEGFVIGIFGGFLYYGIMSPLLLMCLIFQIICKIKLKNKTPIQ